MKHLQKVNYEQKIKEWLELCDLSFELFKSGFQKNKSEAEKLAYNHLTLILKRNAFLKRKTLSKMILK